MKYLLVNDKEEEEQTLLDNIAGFLWDNGNEVYGCNNYDNHSECQNIAKYCDCIVFLIHRDCSAESIFECEQEMLQKYFNLEKNLENKFMLVFTINGVYSNAIPSPHKIFHFEGLYQNELTRFFHWCEKLKLFGKYLS